MAFDQEVGTANLRASYYDGVVKGFAKASYKFKQACTISPTSAWKNYFFRENSTALAGKTGNAVQGIPRGAEFPNAVETWERVSTTIEKYGLEANIPWEDLISDEVDVRERTLFRIAEGVAKAVDDEIFDSLIESTAKGATPSNIQTIILATDKHWGATTAGATSASAAIIDDLLQAKQKIAEYNYDSSDLMCFVSPKDYRSIMNYLAEKGAQFPQMGNEVASNGIAGKVAGVTLVVSNSVTASFALVVVPKRCATWKELYPLTTQSKEDFAKSLTIRAVEMGVTQLTDPKAVVLIQNTQKP